MNEAPSLTDSDSIHFGHQLQPKRSVRLRWNHSRSIEERADNHPTTSSAAPHRGVHKDNKLKSASASPISISDGSLAGFQAAAGGKPDCSSPSSSNSTILPSSSAENNRISVSATSIIIPSVGNSSSVHRLLLPSAEGERGDKEKRNNKYAGSFLSGKHVRRQRQRDNRNLTKSHDELPHLDYDQYPSQHGDENFVVAASAHSHSTGNLLEEGFGGQYAMNGGKDHQCPQQGKEQQRHQQRSSKLAVIKDKIAKHSPMLFRQHRKLAALSPQKQNQTSAENICGDNFSGVKPWNGGNNFYAVDDNDRQQASYEDDCDDEESSSFLSSTMTSVMPHQQSSAASSSLAVPSTSSASASSSAFLNITAICGGGGGGDDHRHSSSENPHRRREFFRRKIEKVKFGVPVSEAFSRDIPATLLVLLLKVNKEGPLKKDIWRAPGNQAQKFLSKIPGGIFEADGEQRLFNMLGQDDLEKQRESFCRVVTGLPIPCQHLLVLLFGTWRLITDAAEGSRAAMRMTPQAIGLSVAPSLFHSCINDGRQQAKIEDVLRFRRASDVLTFVIKHFGAMDLFPRDCYEYYAKITGRTVHAENSEFTFQYPANDVALQRKWLRVEAERLHQYHFRKFHRQSSPTDDDEGHSLQQEESTRHSLQHHQQQQSTKHSLQHQHHSLGHHDSPHRSKKNIRMGFPPTSRHYSPENDNHHASSNIGNDEEECYKENGNNHPRRPHVVNNDDNKVSRSVSARAYFPYYARSAFAADFTPIFGAVSSCYELDDITCSQTPQPTHSMPLPDDDDYHQNASPSGVHGYQSKQQQQETQTQKEEEEEEAVLFDHNMSTDRMLLGSPAYDDDTLYIMNNRARSCEF